MFRKLTLLLAVLALAMAAPAQVMINEILYDTQSTDDPNLLYTEIYGPAGTNLTGWTLVGLNGGQGGAEYRTVTLTGSIPADGYFVIGNTAQVPNVDFVCGGGANAGVDWQNAGSTDGDDCDGIDLRNGDGELIDHVCYGPCATAGACTMSGPENAPDPFPSQGINKAIARIPDHTDTDAGTDWLISETLTPGQPNSGAPCEPFVTDLLTLRQNTGTGEPVYLDTFVVVRGIVNVNNFVFDSTGLSRFYIQDDDAGINIFRGTVPVIAVGDCVVVSGWVDFYRGLTEIASSGSGNCQFSVEVVDQVTPPSPSVITCSSPFEAFEGMLVRINNVTIVSGTWPTEGNYGDLVITDGNGTIGLSISKWTNVDGSPQPTGTFSIIGIMTQYDNTSPYDSYHEILPRDTSDIIRGSAVGDPNSAVMAEEFVLSGTYPNPFNSTAQIRFTVGSARELNLAIYDLMGREVVSEKLTGLNPGEHSYTWTPTGATGVYLLRVSGENRTETAKLLYLK